MQDFYQVLQGSNRLVNKMRRCLEMTPLYRYSAPKPKISLTARTCCEPGSRTKTRKTSRHVTCLINRHICLIQQPSTANKAKLSPNPALETHFCGLAFSLQQFDLVSILLLQSTLRAVFVGEKCTTAAIYYWYGLILRPAVQCGSAVAFVTVQSGSAALW